eukprot:gene5148-7168_t
MRTKDTESLATINVHNEDDKSNLLNAGLALICRYSQGVLKEKYSSSETVFVAESLKLIISGYLAINDTNETDASGQGLVKLFWLLKNSKKIIALVIMYGIANLCTFYALARIDASVYTVLTQLKTFSTALFSVGILGRQVSGTKWRALILLVVGCLLVASPTFNHPASVDIANKSDLNSLDKSLDTASYSASKNFKFVQSMMGIAAVILMVVLSGYSAVYFEDMLKKSGERITIWERNFQLAFYSAVFLLIISFYDVFTQNNNYNQSSSLIPATEHSISYLPFQGWTMNTVIIACLQAAGGLLVAATLKYADAILKTLATSGSIVLSTLIGYVLLGGTLDSFVFMGCFTTILAIFNYTLDNDNGM